MKRIYFIRHAKSSWKNMQLSDMQRPLNRRGKRDAPLMAERLETRVSQIDLALVSPAQRAKDTSLHFIEKLNPDEIIEETNLYHASTNTLLEVLRAIPDPFESVMVFGHNPGFTYLHNYFAEKVLDNLPTTGIYHMISKVDLWSDLSSENTTVQFLIYPKMFITG